METTGIFAAIEAAYQDGTFPCAVVAARFDGGRRIFKAIGCPDPEGRAGVPASEATLFDLASLTKPLATSLLALKAVEAGGLELDAPLGRYLPGAAGASLGATVRQVLAHTAGLPPEPRLQSFFPDPGRIDREEAVSRLLAIEPEGRPGLRVVYSCTGFQLLGLALERIGGARLSLLFAREIAGPLGLSDGRGPGATASAPTATFLPAPELGERCAPTESCPWRGRRLKGMVHDESSYCLGGDGGNAGLFANLAGAEVLFSVWKDGAGLLAESTVRMARALATAGLERRRGLGVQLHDAETCDTPAWPEDAYGHTGFTGNSAWCAPASPPEPASGDAGGPGVSVVSLTNRVYFGRAETAAKIVRFRHELHGAVAELAFARARARAHTRSRE
ncbi:MAG: beta-lactamase family protein [Spirochaetaceae bacterium]|nr:beta-lactamase family protein [Spirochaetaceae bacterium]